MAGIFDLDFKGIFDGLGGCVKDIRTAITGIDPTVAGQVNLALIALESKIADAQPMIVKAQEEDRASAREMESEYVKAGKKNWLQQFLGYGAIIMLGFIIFALFEFNIKPEIKDLLNIIIGGLLKIVYDLYGYYFGGSLGSDQKNTMIADVLSKFKKE